MKKVVLKLRQEVRVKVNIVTSDDIKDFTARYIIKPNNLSSGEEFLAPSKAVFLVCHSKCS